jgi:hypothetical protein
MKKFWLFLLSRLPEWAGGAYVRKRDKLGRYTK